MSPTSTGRFWGELGGLSVGRCREEAGDMLVAAEGLLPLLFLRSMRELVAD
jgi:hypothetical protein